MNSIPEPAPRVDTLREHRMVWRGKQVEALLEEAREVDIEGALRASKTTLCLRKELKAAARFPGIHILLSRWTDDATHGLLKPLWRAMCLAAGIALKWHGEEQYDELPNKARVYIRGLKSQDQTNRYAKFRGLTLARVYVDQAEELPQDVYLELAARLSQKGFPHQITISPQAVEIGHWIDTEFPATNPDPKHRKYITLSVRDNAHNLDPSVIPALERLYPPSHPKHRTLVLGLRGMNVIGEPVYKGAFMRAVHEVEAEFDPALPLEVALDFGKHHPCMVARQRSALGQVRYLAGILGQSLYLDDFLDIVVRHLSSWFPGARQEWCCDPAGASDTSHGTKGALSILNGKGIKPKYRPDANSPAVRLATVERIAAQMRKRAADRSEAFVVSKSERWLRISETNSILDRFLADGFEAGYVWDEHTVSVANKEVRKPKKDGWYEHGQNCAEYLEVNFSEPIAPKKEPPKPAPVPTSYAWT